MLVLEKIAEAARRRHAGATKPPAFPVGGPAFSVPVGGPVSVGGDRRVLTCPAGSYIAGTAGECARWRAPCA